MESEGKTLVSTFLYYGDFQHFGYCENWIAEALDRNGHHCLRVQRRRQFAEEPICTIADKFNATHLLLSKAPEVTAENLRNIRSHSGMKVVLWSFDHMAEPENWKWFGPQAVEADITFMTDGTDADLFYGRSGMRRVELHQGCPPEFDRPDGQDWSDRRSLAHGLTTYATDVLFIGSMYTHRRKRLAEELMRYPNFRKWGEPGSVIWGREFAAACYLSKIVVGDNFVNDVPGYWSDRVYLTLACGGFFLTAYVPGLENEFENGRHLVWWNDWEDLHKQIEYYLPREAERRAIALEGHRLVHREHTYDRRIQRMTEELAKL
jgi:Glycosyl transferases group 1